MSRLGAIQTAVGVHVTAAFTAAGETVTLGYDPIALDSVQQSEFPFARIIFEEEEPERLAFKQERRRVAGTVLIGMLDATRENVDARIEAIRDLIFADETLSSTVDDITCEAGVTFSSSDAPKKFGTLDIATEEVF
jgi:hypothetical protein